MTGELVAKVAHLLPNLVGTIAHSPESTIATMFTGVPATAAADALQTVYWQC
jgi:hypothetical protein